MRSYPRMSDDTIQLLAALALAAALALVFGNASRAEAAKGTKASRPPVSDAAKQNAAESTTSKSVGAQTSGAMTSTAVLGSPEIKSAPEPPRTSSSAPSDSGMILKGGQEHTDFRTLTIEGEDRVHVEVERPALKLDLDPEKVAGLESGTARDVLNRTPPDLTSTYYALTADEPMPYLGRPWLDQFATGAVARFQPKMDKVDRWKLVVADSKGQTVREFQGKGDPPKEIVWDGRTQDGSLVTPGLTYSYYLEAYDRAGNKRNFVGEGFRVSAYRVDTPLGPVLVFSGSNLSDPSTSSRLYGPATASKATSPILLEAASWINQSTKMAQPIRVTVTARGRDQANLLAKQVGTALAELTLGDPARVQAVASVEQDAPDGGTIQIALGVTPPAGGSLSPGTPAASKSAASKNKKSTATKKGKK
jgi:hypothetical protein